MKCEICGNSNAKYTRVFAAIPVTSIIWGLASLTSKIVVLCASCKSEAHNLEIPVEEYLKKQKRRFKLKKLLDK